MRFRLEKKKYIWKPTRIQKGIGLAVVSAGLTTIRGQTECL